jgi:hypothetical protein
VARGKKKPWSVDQGDKLPYLHSQQPTRKKSQYDNPDDASDYV